MSENEFLLERITNKNYVPCILARKKNIDGLMIYRHLIYLGVVFGAGYQTGEAGSSWAEDRWFVTLIYNY